VIVQRVSERKMPFRDDEATGAARATPSATPAGERGSGE
jgi:hypothetical protein